MRKTGEPSGGFTIAELLFAMAILLVVLIGSITAITYAAMASKQNAMRENASDLATRELEYARTIPYENLGTKYADGTYGDPPGSLLVSETVGDFSVQRTVSWVRDTATGRATYKRVTVVVSWNKPVPSSVSAETGIYGKDTSSNTGDVQLTVLDADNLASGVPGAVVTLAPTSGASRWVATDSTGIAFFGYVPYGSTISGATKSGWMADMATFNNPTVKKVSADTLNQWTLLMQQPSDVTVHVTDGSGASLPGAAVTLVNTERSLTYNGTTDSNGNVLFGQLWAATGAGYTLSATKTGYLGAGVSFAIASGGLHLNQALALGTPTPFTVMVTDKATGSAVAGAAVALSGPQSFSGTTNGSGSVTFSVQTGGTYTVSVSASGFSSHSSSTVISVGSGSPVTYPVQLTRPTYLRVICQSSVSPYASVDAVVAVGGVGSQTTTSGSATFVIPATGDYSFTATPVTPNPYGYQAGTSSTHVDLGTDKTVTLSLTPTKGCIDVFAHTSSGSLRANVRIRVYIIGSSTVIADGYTDSDGHIVFTNLDPRTDYRIRRGSSGSNYYQPVTVTAGSTTDVDWGW